MIVESNNHKALHFAQLINIGTSGILFQCFVTELALKHFLGSCARRNTDLLELRERFVRAYVPKVSLPFALSIIAALLVRPWRVARAANGRGL